MRPHPARGRCVVPFARTQMEALQCEIAAMHSDQVLIEILKMLPELVWTLLAVGNRLFLAPTLKARLSTCTGNGLDTRVDAAGERTTGGTVLGRCLTAACPLKAPIPKSKPPISPRCADCGLADTGQPDHAQTVGTACAKRASSHWEHWRRVPESNRCTRICNPLRNHSANSPNRCAVAIAHVVWSRKAVCEVARTGHLCEAERDMKLNGRV